MWSLHTDGLYVRTGLIRWEIDRWGLATCGPYNPVVFIYWCSLQQGLLYWWSNPQVYNFLPTQCRQHVPLHYYRPLDTAHLTRVTHLNWFSCQVAVYLRVLNTEKANIFVLITNFKVSFDEEDYLLSNNSVPISEVAFGESIL